jgi:hypothetical protein
MGINAIRAVQADKDLWDYRVLQCLLAQAA